MSNEVEIKTGQLWKASALGGFKIVKVVTVGEQPKRRRITYTDVDRGYTFTEYESAFRTLFSLRRDVSE